MFLASSSIGQLAAWPVGRWRLRELAVAALLALAVVLQWCYVVRAALSAPQLAALGEAGAGTSAGGANAGVSGFVLASCVASAKGGKVPGTLRDCAQGQAPSCSLAQPCTPCSVDLTLTLTPRRGGAACAACSDANPGDCGFLPGIGPYCDFGAAGGGVAPCRRCCA